MTTTVKIVNMPDCEIEITPGQTVTPIPTNAVTRFGFVKLMRLPDGSYTPVLQSWSETIRLGHNITEKLGLDIDDNTLRRLVLSGLVEGRWVTPRVCLVSLESLYQHLEACRDREYWTPDRTQQYLKARREYF